MSSQGLTRRKLLELGERKMRAAEDHHIELAAVRGGQLPPRREEISDRDRDRVRAHFVIAAFVARWRRGEPRLSAEADAVAWIDPKAIGDFRTTPELPWIIAKAAAIERSLL